MTYPSIAETSARIWYREWKDACLSQSPATRVPAPESPKVVLWDGGEGIDWEDLCASLCEELSKLSTSEDQATFEREGALLVHHTLPDDPALRDVGFWYWLAIVPGREVILDRYGEPEQPGQGSDQPPKNPLPHSENFFGANARENLFFRLWIRGEMAREPGYPDPYEYARPGLIDFWRSHVFRQLYAHHRPFMEAFIDFQFPETEGSRGTPRLNTSGIRTLAKELKLACANISVEALDRTQSATLIERVYASRMKGAEA